MAEAADRALREALAGWVLVATERFRAAGWTSTPVPSSSWWRGRDW
ncbi:hypothetical protein [Streptomyces sp. B22F1]